jgi:serine/threonine-protein kinase/endoribonuclease IRE1
VNNFIRFAAAILFLPWFVEAQQQQRPAVPHRHESPHEGLDLEASHTLDVTKIPHSVETPLTHNRRKNTLSVSNLPPKNDASAIATLAPANSAVVAPSSRQSGASGLSSPHIARSLEDWKVEDFVLLATVDGKLHARDRKTGKERWQLEYMKPMVETKYHRKNRLSIDKDYDPISIDDYLWIVEPSRDGSLFIYRPGGSKPGLVNTGLTMKRLVEEMSPYAGQDPPVTYVGSKKTNMITVDANNGKVLSFFGTEGTLVNDDKCVASDGRTDNKEECPKTSTLTIGRTEYTITITGEDGHHITTLTFSEWSPNNFDNDLQRQYHKTLDNKYIYTSHDGGVIGLDHDRNNADEPGRLFKHKFTSPVVRVFDVAKPWNGQGDSKLVILPQPNPPAQEDEVSASHRASSIFLNHTEDGSWYAMSGKTYPLAIRGIRQAQCNQQGWLQHRPQWDLMNDRQLSEALVGLHSIEHSRPERLLSISAPNLEDNQTTDPVFDTTPALIGDQDFLQYLQQIPRMAAKSVRDFFQNPLLLVFLAGLLWTYNKQVKVLCHRAGQDILNLVIKTPKSGALLETDRLPAIPKAGLVEISGVGGTNESATEKVAKVEEIEVVQTPATTGDGLVPSKPDTSGEEKLAPAPEKKKAHRGRRGGVKHKKGRAASTDGGSQDGNPPKPLLTIDDAVKDAQNMGPQTKLEPDIRTIPSDPQEVSGPIIRIASLEVNTDRLIGTGSNGTMVFEGKFDGREVAVKRMLIQFFDIASQETKLLRESDDHPNGTFYNRILTKDCANLLIVIRYFAQQAAAGFLYIALELCPASLADVIDKPLKHRELAHAGEKDLPNVLYQITNGLSHLHSLRIVHRDLKPQNILVAMGKDGKPRLLVSDFGLCKKLEGEQSSFRATTAHAAGTSGWRAPELLLDDDAKDGQQAVVDASTDGGSGSVVIGADLLPNRRATRAIDIFSLGLVFFYVLTKGCHPFDCGDRFMREVNIRKGSYDLAPLEVLGDYAYEAKDLISSMLARDPKQRPQAHQVMAHPFFWSPKKRLNFLCDVSDHFEKEKRDPPSAALVELESYAPSVCGTDFLKLLGKDFVESMGKQRKYTGTRLLDLLRALRNKRNHYEDMSDKLKKDVGALPEGYLSYWTSRFPNLLITCWNVVYDVQWDETDRFREYYLPAGL